MGRPKSRRGLAVAFTALAILSFSVLQLVDHVYLLKSFIYLQSSSSSFFESLPSFVATTTTTTALGNNFTFWFPQSGETKSDSGSASSSSSSLWKVSSSSSSSSSSIERQIATPQDIPRRNVSRSLCGAILTASPKATRFPRILSSQAASSKACSPNAILYMVQKGKHSSYNRNSTALFLKSLDKLYENYLSIDQHAQNADVLIVHSGDYTKGDLDYLDRRYNHTVHFKLIDVSDTDYWTIPESVRNDNISNWNVYPEFSVGYRHMIRWYALKLYDFVRDYAETTNGCSYRYLMRMDEDSFIHSPIRYDMFEFMQIHNFSYAFRMCAYEMETDVWEDYEDHVGHCGLSSLLPHGTPIRRITTDLCAFYNNFFVLDVHFIFQPQVQHFLQWNDAVGVMYRERYNDLQIQAIAVYHFLPPERIHRFLDFTYEHMSSIQIDELQCPYWGAIQAGYLDTNVNTTFDRFRRESNMNRHRCPSIRRNFAFRKMDLSPTYSHLPPPSWWNETFGVHRDDFRWTTIAAGSVEGRSRGIMSG